MEINIYQQCPINSGKKIKFCCGGDFVSDLDQIVAKCSSNQSLSALDHINRVIDKHGKKGCLLNLKTHILFTLGEIDQAAEVNAEFVASNPNNPLGRQHEAMTLLAKGEIHSAINKLQDAMDLVEGDGVPLPMINTFKTLGSLLLSAGHVIAARAHLQFAMSIRNDDDEQLMRLFAESFRLPGLPLILKSDFKLDPAPEDCEWASKYEIVIQTLSRGQFRLAEKMLEKMDRHWPEQLQIVRGIATVKSMLAREDEMAAAWAKVAELPEIARWQAVEAAAIAQIFLPEEPTGTLDNVVISWSLSDLDLAFQAMDAHRRFVAMPCPAENPLEEGPPPRYAFALLDREAIDAREDLNIDEIPLVVGELFLFGKQTDQESRIVWMATRDHLFDDVKKFLGDLLSDAKSGDSESEETMSTTSVAARCLAWNWHVPEGVGIEQHRSLLDKKRREVIIEKWPNLKFSCLQDKTPLEAAGDEELSIALEAAVTNLEQSTAIQLSGQDEINELKKMLKIDEPSALNAQELDVDYLTPLRACQIDPTTLNDEQIVRLYADSMSINNARAMKNLIPEILGRESLADQIPRDICYLLLAQLSQTNEGALENLQLARQEAKKAGRSTGMILVQELEIRLSRGITDKLPELLQTIQSQHLSDPNVEYNLVRVLSKFGLISPDGRTVSLPTSEPGSKSSKPAESTIWTPESEAVPTNQSGEESASKIWVPGSD